MFVKIKFGIFKLDITDHYAILGIPVNCDPKQIRIKYLKVAQRLHPDTFIGENDEKNMAKKIFTNLVNPSYEKLSKEKSRKEFDLILWEKGRRLSEEGAKISVASEPAKKLLHSGKDYEKLYDQLFEIISKNQYQTIKESLVKMAQLSELNLIYLILKQGLKTTETASTNGKAPETPASKPAQTTQGTKKAASNQESQATKQVKNQTTNEPAAVENSPETEIQLEAKATKTEEDSQKSKVDSYLKRAIAQIEKEKHAQAIVDLRDALKLEPSNSTCHAYISLAYLKQSQIPMARVHLKKARELNPKDPKVKEVQEELAKVEPKNKKKAAVGKGDSQDKSKDKSEKKETKVFGIKLW